MPFNCSEWLHLTFFFSCVDNKYKFSPENYGVLKENKELFFFPVASYANVQ